MSPQIDQARLSHPVRMWRIVTIAALLLAAAGFYLGARNFNTQAAIKSAQLENCQQVGNPIVSAVEAVVRQQIESSSHVDPKFFPSIPKAQLLALIHEQQSQRRAILRTLTRLPSCVERYG